MSTADARAFLTRFTGRFRAEDLAGLRRLFSPSGGDYQYLADDPIPLEQDYSSLFDHVHVVDYQLTGVRISTRGRGATIRARYSYGDRRGPTKSGRPWLFRGDVTFHLLAHPGSGVRLERVVARPDVVLTEQTSAPSTTTSARVTIGSAHPVVIGSTTQRFTAGEHFLAIPLNSIGRHKVTSDMKVRVTGQDTPGRRWTNEHVVLPYAS